MAASTLDVKGLKCPLPVLKVSKAMKALEPGAVLEVFATDPLAVIDIPNFCNESGNDLVESSQSDGVLFFKIKKT
ncbi:MAG: sulfurtransferase TusA family protein [Pseudomonadota bacterium]